MMRTVLILIAALVAAAAPAHGAQILVGPGDAWDDVAERATAGDEIILMPGAHRTAVLEDLAGTDTSPIIIRAIDPEHAVTISADRYGLRLIRPKHVVIRDVIIEGASIAGIDIDDRKGGASENVSFERVTVRRTGPKGERHAIRAIRVAPLRVSECTFEGWAGAAIDAVACADVVIENSTFTGLDEHGQQAGVRVRGVTTNVTISNNRFVDAGVQVLSIGAPTIGDEVTLLPQAEPGTLAEAVGVVIERNTIVGGYYALAIHAAHGVDVGMNTIRDPKRCVFAVVDGEHDARLGTPADIVLIQNLICWAPGTIETVAEMSPQLDADAILALEQNLWWFGNDETEWERVGPLPGKHRFAQVLDVDPGLDETLKVTSVDAELFGPDAP